VHFQSFLCSGLSFPPLLISTSSIASYFLILYSTILSTSIAANPSERFRSLGSTFVCKPDVSVCFVPAISGCRRTLKFNAFGAQPLLAIALTFVLTLPKLVLQPYGLTPPHPSFLLQMAGQHLFFCHQLLLSLGQQHLKAAILLAAVANLPVQSSVGLFNADFPLCFIFVHVF